MVFVAQSVTLTMPLHPKSREIARCVLFAGRCSTGNQNPSSPTMSMPSPMKAFRGGWRRLKEHPLSRLGPGLITGAANDDPSGVVTYSQAGAQFGLNMLWTMPLAFPLMAAIQFLCGLIGRVTGRGLSANIKDAFPPGCLVHPLGYASRSLQNCLPGTYEPYLRGGFNRRIPAQTNTMTTGTDPAISQTLGRCHASAKGAVR